MKKRKIDKTSILEISKKTGTVAFLFLACVGVVVSVFFASVTSFQQTNQIMVNEASYLMTGDDIILAQLQNKDDGESTLINPDDWPVFVKAFNKALKYDASVFKCIDDGFVATNADGLFSQPIVVSDITINYYNPLYSSNNIVFLNSDNMRDFDDESIIIEQAAALRILNLSSDDEFAQYADLHDYPITITNEGHSDTYYVSGIYDSSREVSRRDFSGLFGELGDVFFVSTNAALKYGPGKIYVSFTNSYSLNATIFSFLRKLIANNKLFIQFPDFQVNNIDIDGTPLIYLRGKLIEEYQSWTNILLAVLMWLITASLIIIIVDVFDDVRKIVATWLGKRISESGLIIASLALLSSFIIIGALIQIVFSRYYYFNGFIVDFLFPSSIMAFVITYLVIVALCFATALRSIILARVKQMAFIDVNSLIKDGNKENDILSVTAGTKLSEEEYRHQAIIVGGLSLPNQSAGANRIKGIIRMFNENGYMATVLGYYPASATSIVHYKAGYDIIPYYDDRDKKFLHKALALLLPTRTIKKILLSFLTKRTIDVIYLYSVLPISTVIYLQRLAKKHHIKLIYDVVEFQTLIQQNGKSFFTYYLPNMFINHLMINDKSHVVAISRYLESHFQKKKAQTFLLPYVNVSDDIEFVSDNSLKKKTTDKIFLYVGSPFGKDDIASIIRGFLLLDERSLLNIKVVFAGFQAFDCYRLSLTTEELKRCSTFCSFLGKLPHDKIDELYRIADYTVLLRNDKARCAKAGFSTKVVESWGHGTPVIANYSGDLEAFLIDGDNGLRVKSSSPLDFKQAIERALLIDEKQYRVMRMRARLMSTQKLDYRSYVASFKSFLGDDQSS